MKQTNYLTIEEMISMPTLSSTTISEDGKNVVFIKNVPDWKENKYINEIWIYEKEKDKKSLLSINEEAHSLVWSPDAKSIAYLCATSSGQQLFVRNLENDVSVQITHEKEGVSKFKWASSGDGVYYLTNATTNLDVDKRTELYGDYCVIDEERFSNNLNYIHLKQSCDYLLVYPLIDDNLYIAEFDVSQDGENIAIVAAPSPSMRDYIHRDIYIKSRKEGELIKLNRNKLIEGSVYFSPQGNKICYSASIKEKDFYEYRIQENTLEIYDLHNGDILQPLEEHDSTLLPIRWTEKGILIRWQDKTNYRLGMLSDNGSVQNLLDFHEGFVLDPSITGDGTHFTYLLALKNETFEVYVNHQKITNENCIFDGKLRSNRDVISWESSDGTEIEGVLTTPVNYDVTKKYPLLIVAHGGPAWASFSIFSNCFNGKYPIEQFIEKGFIVLEPNYRGSSGYGNEFLQANYQKLGLAYYDDVISGVDTLIEKGVVDEQQIGIMGWSNGGYVTAFCSTYSNRFKAASVGGGITNWSSHYVHTDIPYSIKMYLGTTPWENPALYGLVSPVNYLKSASTPTLIQHGEDDIRVPITNAYELYRGLKEMNVPTKLVVFKGMAYSSHQPKVNATIMEQNLTWFLNSFQDDTVEDYK